MITGKVVSDKGVSLPYASVKLLQDSIEAAHALCDSAGNFFLDLSAVSVKPDAGYHLQANYLKLSSSRVALGSSSVYQLVINDNASHLLEVTVTATQPVFLRKSDRFIFIPNKALTEGNDALEIMRRTPLVQYDERTEAFSIINKPGTIVYINNRKSILPKEMLIATLRSLPAENIRSIEIITNPGSEYAANTTGGIININIKRQLYEGWLGNLAILTEQSGYNTTILNGSVNYRKGKFALQLIPFINNSFNFNKTDNTITYSNALQNLLHSTHHREYLVLGGGLNIDYDINPSNLLSFSGWLSNVDGNSTTNTLTSFTKKNQGTTDSSLSSVASGTDNYIYNYGSFNYHHLFNNNTASYLDVSIDYNNFSQKRKYDGYFNTEDPATRYHNDLPQKFNNLSERIEWVYPFKQKNKISFGVQNSHSEVENNLKYYNREPPNGFELNTALSNNYAYQENYQAGFISLSRSFNNKWSSTAGLRLENTDYITEVTNKSITLDTNYLNLFPSFSVSYSPVQKHQFGFNFNRKITRPNIELLFPGRTYYNENYFKENNPFLQPALYYNWELSYTLKSQYNFIASYSTSKNNYAGFVIPVIEDNVTRLKSTYLNYRHTNRFNLAVNLYQPVFKNVWDVIFSPTADFSSYEATLLNTPVKVNNSSYTIFFDNYIYLSQKKKWTAFLTFKYNSTSKDISGQQLNATSSLDFMVKKVMKKFAFYIILSDIYQGNNLFRNNLYTGVYPEKNSSVTQYYSRAVSVKVRYNFGNQQLKGNRQKNAANDDIRNRAGK